MKHDRCPHCHKPALAWETLSEGSEHLEVQRCGRCGHEAGRESWTLPLDPPRPGTCRNCGGRRRGQQCRRCGLSAHEDVMVHEELQRLVDPGTDLLVAADLAAESGRRVLALKLATAAAHRPGDRMVARLLRLALLQDLGELDAALGDTRWWVEEAPDSHAAWSSHAEILLANERIGEGLEALWHTLELQPSDHITRARLAEQLFTTGRFGMAREQAVLALSQDEVPEARAVALELLTAYACRLMNQGDRVAVDELLGTLGERVEPSATLLAVSAWVCWEEGHKDAARERLREAWRMDGDNALVQELRPKLGLKRWSWWRWS